MIGKAKIFTSGGSQAVRLPKEFRFENNKEVIIKKYGKIIVLIPEDLKIWKEFFENQDKVTEDFLKERI